MKGSPVDPNRIYASQTSGWFGQVIQRSMTAAKPGTNRDASREHHGPDGMPKGESNNLSTSLCRNRSR